MFRNMIGLMKKGGASVCTCFELLDGQMQVEFPLGSRIG